MIYSDNTVEQEANLQKSKGALKVTDIVCVLCALNNLQNSSHFLEVVMPWIYTCFIGMYVIQLKITVVHVVAKRNSSHMECCVKLYYEVKANYCTLHEGYLLPVSYRIDVKMWWYTVIIVRLILLFSFLTSHHFFEHTVCRSCACPSI